MIKPEEIQLIISLIKSLPAEDQAEFFAEIRENGFNVAAKLILVRAFKKERERLDAEIQNIDLKIQDEKDKWEKSKASRREEAKKIVKESNKQYREAFETFKHELSLMEKEFSLVAEADQKKKVEQEISEIEDSLLQF